MIAGGYDPTDDGLAQGCRSAQKPCAHQKRDPTTICSSCQGLPEGQRATLMQIAGARLAGNAFMQIHTAAGPVYRECRMAKRVWTPLVKGRTLMASSVRPLLDAGYVQMTGDGAHVLIEQTDKRP